MCLNEVGRRGPGQCAYPTNPSALYLVSPEALSRAARLADNPAMTQIVVQRTGEILVSDLEVAKSHWARFRGLMMRASLPPGAGLDIVPCGSIHMMFMRFPIDAVFYNPDGAVTKVAQGVRPWIGLAFGGKGARGVLELPAGAAANVQPGDLLERVP
jgi:uncharacterized membrane protein (UPF0127 family)